MSRDEELAHSRLQSGNILHLPKALFHATYHTFAAFLQVGARAFVVSTWSALPRPRNSLAWRVASAHRSRCTQPAQLRKPVTMGKGMRASKNWLKSTQCAPTTCKRAHIKLTPDMS